MVVFAFSKLSYKEFAPAKLSKIFKHYQKGDIKDGEKNFAHRAGKISPVESEPRASKLLPEHQFGLL